MPLEEYAAKRDASKTPEPFGGQPHEAPRFVVQQHAASRMHWDFRLELDGVLLSWAVPKGPSLDPADKRLAVHVEDHPLDYADFEGVIPAGEYGGGSVIVWDRGTWEPVGDAAAGLAKGDFKFRLFGSKLTGLWVLVRMKPRGNERAENWLLIKERDEHAIGHDVLVVTEAHPESVISGRTVAQIAEGVPVASGASPAAPADADAATEAGPPAAASTLPPALALCMPASVPPRGEGWIAEVKYDGYRIAIEIAGDSVRCLSRAGRDVTARYPHLADAARTLPTHDALLDGEAVVFDERGATDFGALQSALKDDPASVAYVAFDLLRLNGHDLTHLATTARKDLLAALLGPTPPPHMRFAEHLDAGGNAFFEAACAQGLEGAVFKRADSPYPSGRTREWVKVKCRREQEFVVAGFTEPHGGRVGFGALLLGHHEGTRLVYAGRVGSGFTADDLEQLAPLLHELERPDSPFGESGDTSGAREDARVHWVEPRLVAQVAFAEWTAHGLLRQASFRGMRDDKAATEVVREQPGDSAPGLYEPPATSGEVRVAGVRISNPEKCLFPDSDLPKLELARYYEAVAPWMLAEVSGRPLTLVRCPVGGNTPNCFHQRHPDRGLSTHVGILRHELRGHDAPDEWLTVDSVAGLVSLAQMGVAEVHTWLSHTDAPSRPDRLVFDLDPGPSVSWPQVVDAARTVADELDALGFTPHVKSTGSKGLHVVCALEPVWEFPRVHALAQQIAERIAARDPDHLTARMAKSKRDGRVFIDYVRNSEAASAVAAYSTRYLPGPPVAVPLAWDELDDAALDIRAFTPARVMERLRAGTDPWSRLADTAAGVRVLKAAEGSLDI